MIYECWLFMSTGLPLWNKQFEQVKHTLDPVLIAGLLTATKSFANQAMGSELQDLILEDERLHSYRILDGFAQFSIHVDKRVDLNRIDQCFEIAHHELRKAASEKDINIEELEQASFQTLQKFIEISRTVLEVLIEDLLSLKNELFIIYDEGQFDQGQLTLLKEVPSIVPFLVRNECSLTIRDLKTQKIHFQQIYKHMDAEKALNLYELINTIENNLTPIEKNLEKSPGYLLVGGTANAFFKVKEVENNLFIIFKDNIESEKYNHFRKLVIEIKKRVENYYN